MAKNKNKNKKMSKDKKILLAVLTAAIVIALIIAIIFISVKGMWGQIFESLHTIIQENGQPSGDSGSINPSGDITVPSGDTGGDTELIPDGTLEVKVLDVGQGDCILITFPDGQRMVMDAGNESRNDVAATALDNELANNNIMAIDYLFLTHTDQDHSRDMETILEKYDVKNIYFPRASLDTSKTWERAYNAAKNEAYIESGETKQAEYHENIGQFRIETTSWRMKCYSFEEVDYPNIKSGASAENKNSVSPICLLEYAGRTIVLTGDANFKTEEYVLARGYLDGVDADVLKVGHHGSETSTSTSFLNEIDCEYAVISVGEGNKYDHPRDITLQRLADYKDIVPDDDFNGFAEVYRTDEDGTITVRVDENGAMQINSADSPEKNAALEGTITENAIEQSGEVALMYFKQDDYGYMAA